MCGIAGLVEPEGRQADADLLLRMTRALSHRGPDDEGFHFSGRVGLGHRRLSIIDLNAGHQPMSNGQKTLWVVFNGEIYNYVELRQELEARGCRFDTRSDTEVLLRSYEMDGVDCLQTFRGMFAFAIWDEKEKLLFLARDRMGKKPLYFYQEGQRLAFASEFAALLEDGRIPRRIDPGALDDYLTFGYIPTPGTIFKGIEKLPPAHWMIFQNGKRTTRCYWKIHFEPKRRISEPEAQEEFLRLFKEAVRIRLRSDVPLGVLLSGGLDSSAVTAVAAPMVSKPLETFSVGFEESDFNELPYARTVAAAFSTHHREFVVRPDTLELLPTLIRHYGEPFADSSALATYVLAHMTRHYVTVALNGDGGDENLGGYLRYQALGFSQKLSWMPAALARRCSSLCLRLGARFDGKAGTSLSSLGRFLEASGLPTGRRYARWVSLFTPEQKERLYDDRIRDRLFGRDSWDWLDSLLKDCDASDWVEKAMQADLSSYLPFDPVVKMDIATMAHGLEVRSPLLDHTLMEFLASLPLSFKLRGRWRKWILLKSMSGQLPAKILRRGKQGFGVPVGLWFKGRVEERLRQQLLSPRSPCREFFRQEEIFRLIGEHRSGSLDHAHRLWTLFVFDLWHRIFLQGAHPEAVWEGQRFPCGQER